MLSVLKTILCLFCGLTSANGEATILMLKTTKPEFDSIDDYLCATEYTLPLFSPITLGSCLVLGCVD
jgi:hypothetical protein